METMESLFWEVLLVLSFGESYQHACLPGVEKMQERDEAKSTHSFAETLFLPREVL